METEMNETPGRTGEHEPAPVTIEVVYCEWINKRIDIDHAKLYFNPKSIHCKPCDEYKKCQSLTI